MEAITKKRAGITCLLTEEHVMAHEGVLPKEMNLNKVNLLTLTTCLQEIKETENMLNDILRI